MQVLYDHMNLYKPMKIGLHMNLYKLMKLGNFVMLYHFLNVDCQIGPSLGIVHLVYLYMLCR
jgi:hypothetical protein